MPTKTLKFNEEQVNIILDALADYENAKRNRSNDRGIMEGRKITLDDEARTASELQIRFREAEWER